MSDTLYLGFDTETGDFEPQNGDLLTAYFCVFTEDYQILEELDLKLKPGNDLLPRANAGALKVNGINLQEHLKDPSTISYSEGKTLLIAMIKRHLKKKGRFSNISPFGYNVPFDVKWVQFHLMPTEDWNSMLHYKNVDVMQNVDFLKRAGFFPKELGSLSTVVDYLKIPKRNAHTAKDDTLMTIDVDKKIQEFIRSKKDGGQAQDLIALLEAE